MISHPLALNLKPQILAGSPSQSSPPIPHSFGKMLGYVSDYQSEPEPHQSKLSHLCRTPTRLCQMHNTSFQPDPSSPFNLPSSSLGLNCWPQAKEREKKKKRFRAQASLNPDIPTFAPASDKPYLLCLSSLSAHSQPTQTQLLQFLPSSPKCVIPFPPSP